MAMTPEERIEFDKMKMQLEAIARAEDIFFVENIKRRGAQGINTDGQSASTSITTAVRNATDDGSENVCKVPDIKLKIVSTDGSIYYLPAFNS